MDWVDDGYPDCEDGSDESDNHDHDDHGDDDHNDHHDDGNHISWRSYYDTVNGKAIQMVMILFGGVRNLRTMRTGTHGGITVSTMTQTGTAPTTSDRARNSSTLQIMTSGQVRRMEKMDTTMTMDHHHLRM